MKNISIAFVASLIATTLAAGCKDAFLASLDETQLGAGGTGLVPGAGGAAGKPISCAVTEFLLPTPDSGPASLVVGPDGNLWFTESSANQIGRITPDGVITEFSIAGLEYLKGITAGPDGNLWFAWGGGIGRMTPAGELVPLPSGAASLAAQAITTGPDGNVWVTISPGKIGRITLAGKVTVFPLPSDSQGAFYNSGIDPGNITTGPDGNIWFTEILGNKLGRITPKGTLTMFTATEASAVNCITSGPDGNLWFTEFMGNKLGRITPHGTITEFHVPTPQPTLMGIAAGPDGNIWFAESIGNRIGYVTPAGEVTECPLLAPNIPPNLFTDGPDGGTWSVIASPAAMVAGPDGNMWFTENSANAIARTNPAASDNPAGDAGAGG